MLNKRLGLVSGLCYTRLVSDLTSGHRGPDLLREARGDGVLVPERGLAEPASRHTQAPDRTFDRAMAPHHAAGAMDPRGTAQRRGAGRTAVREALALPDRAYRRG